MKDSLLGESRTSGALHFRRLLKESADERRKQQARSVSNSPQNENSRSRQISHDERERGDDEKTDALDEEAEQKFPNARSANVTLHLIDDQRLSIHRPTRKGDPDDPMSEAELKAKFHALASPVIGTDAAAALANSILR